MNQDLFESRFFKIDDPIIERLDGHKIHPSWWSRFYEYRWALDVVHKYFQINGEKLGICMDGGCGIEHPFKLELAHHFKKVVGVDLDPKILSIKNKPLNLELYFEALENFIYKEPFDVIFCISVLEHMDIIKLKKVVERFNRLLHTGGCLVLTADFPTINLDTIKMVLINNQFDLFGWNICRDERVLNGKNSAYPNTNVEDLRVFRAFAVKKGELCPQSKGEFIMLQISRLLFRFRSLLNRFTMRYTLVPFS